MLLNELVKPYVSIHSKWIRGYYNQESKKAMTGINLDLAGKTALVTGGSRGLGSVICRYLNLAGAKVIIHYNENYQAAKKIKNSLGGATETIQTDLSKLAETRKLIGKAQGHFGPIDVLVNCASESSQRLCPISQLSDAIWNKTQVTNVHSPLVLMQEFAKQRRAGSVINISSIEAKRPGQKHADYAVSKAALEMLSKAAAQEYGSLNIRINAVCPGLIDREGIEKNWPEGVNSWKKASPLNKLVDPEDVAKAVIFLASDSSRSITGSTLTVDCGLSVKSGW